MSSHRMPREQPFLDDPAAYPEFSLLMKRQWMQHAARWALNRHRTAALVALAAFSVKLSGASAPSGGGGDWYTAAGLQAASQEWGACLVKGLALDLLARHFQGFESALAIMLAMTAAAALVYPLHRFIALLPEEASPSPSPPPRHRTSTLLLSALAVLSTAGAPPWALAVWGAGRRDWGLASGLGVGLLAACLSLKGVSFAQQCWRCRPSSSARGAVPPPATVSKHSGRGRERGRNGERAGVPLTSGEFLFFLLAAPTLVCEPRFLRASCRRRPRFLRAASEFSHAALAFVALHASCSALFAPALRVVATFLFSSPSAPCSRSSSSSYSYLSCEGGDGGGGGSWVDCAGWVGKGGVFSAGGSGGWLFALLPGGEKGGGATGGGGGVVGMGFFEMFFCGTGGGGGGGGGVAAGWPEFAAAAAWAILVLSPMVHFLTFYAFWHCVCMGLAELTGYPDRFFYGPWWLLSEEPDTMFRLWSTPVHRWLSSCVYRPTVDYGGGGSSSSNGEKKKSGTKQRRRRRRVLGITAAFGVSSVVHEAVTYVAMRQTCWPFNTFCLMFAVVVIAGWDAVYPVVSAISDVSEISEIGDGDEPARTPPLPPKPAVSTPSNNSTTGDDDGGSAGEGRPPPGTGVRPTSGALAASHGVGENSFVGGSQVGLGGGGGGGGGSEKKKAGSEWRGWGAVAFFGGASMLMGLVVDFLAWQWWRHTLLR